MKRGSIVESNELQQTEAITEIVQTSTHTLSDAAYYRSRLFTAKGGVNPLVTAAQPLLCLSERLRGQQLPDIDINNHISHEIKAFESRASQLNYGKDTIHVARHIIDVVLNEFIDRQQSDNHFFEILQKAKIDPVNHIDLLELMFICLRLGYQGQYKTLENGRIILDDLCDEVYQLIRKQRGDEKIELFVKSRVASNMAQKAVKPLSLWLFIAFAMTLIFTFNIGFSYFLNSSANSLLRDTQIINQQITFARDALIPY